MATDQAQPGKGPLVVLLGLTLVAGVLAGGFWLGAQGGADGPAEVSAPAAAPVVDGADGAVEPGAAPAKQAEAPSGMQAEHASSGADAAPVEANAADVDAADAVAPEDLYQPTGAETELAGLRAAEAGNIGQPALVMFHADWCHVCQQIMPTVTDMRDQYEGKVAFLKMNVDDADSRAPSQTYRVRGTPTFVLFDRHGNVATQFSGWPGEGRVAQALDQVAAVQ